MKRAPVLVTAIALIAGCQAQNPYAAFGPTTVPPPGLQAAPYYPPGAGPPATTAAPPSSAAPPRLSVSASGPSAPFTSNPSITADPADREPIRIVENTAPAKRTTAAGSSGALTPAGTPTPTQPGHVPAGSSPSYNRTRGYTPSPGGGASSNTHRSNQSVVPAAYFETPAATSGWRAR